MNPAGTRFVEAFARQFGALPTHIVHSPGRVNLIGEHIDYHGLPVLPMAIDREIQLLFRHRDDGIIRASALADDFPSACFELSADIPAAEAGDWSNYIRGAAQSLVSEHGASRGIDLLVDSTLPMAAGLSSSSALVVGAGLALASTNQVGLNRCEFAGEMADAERYTGTQGGGMDQAVCLLAETGHALYVDFRPLSVRPVPMTPDLQIIVAHSLVTAEKSGSARTAYNELRIAGEFARSSVAMVLGLPPDTDYSSLVEIGEQSFQAATDALDGAALRCFRHVFSEALRVRAAVEALESSDLFLLGRLVNESHESLRTDVQVSTPELDQLVTLARDAGAVGARLTGAGFGGTMIALVQTDQAELICEAMASGFYRPRGVSDPEAAGKLHTVQPSGCARVEALP